ncbi:MAG: hypothetical protein E7B35_24530 [Escherichia coli]|nr:hypothetical protein [Escherichia coli]
MDTLLIISSSHQSLDTERDFGNTWSNTGCIQVAEKGARKPNGL